MGLEFSTGFCTQCNEQKKIIRKTPNHILHLLISLFTIGIWIIPWIMFSTIKENWRCHTCGEIVSFCDSAINGFLNKIEEIGYVKTASFIILGYTVSLIIYKLLSIVN